MTAGDYEFSKKPRRMTSPPQNRRQWLDGYRGVEVLLETDPARIAYFAREATWGDIMAEPTEAEMADTLAEVVAGRVLGSAIEVPAFGFRIRASRSAMDQMLRLRESAAGAQTTRDNDQRDFNIVVPNMIDELSDRDPDLYDRVRRLVAQQREVYGALVDAGIPPQDARFVALPLGFQTQWIQIMNLRAMTKMCEQRLCNSLTQHETNYLVRVMRDLVVAEYPWTDPMLRSHCEKRGACSGGTLLFPGCGAFGGTSSDYDPDKHLYPAYQNDGMRFAEWDRFRVRLENNPDVGGPVPFAVDPEDLYG